MPVIPIRNGFYQGAGYVVFPFALLTHPDLTDSDVRVLLVLDHLAFRSGARDGLVVATNEEIGVLAHKSPGRVQVSLRRIEAIRPQVVVREMSSCTRRDAIRVCYDRHGDERLNTGDTTIVRIAEAETSADRKRCSDVPIIPLPIENEVATLPVIQVPIENDMHLPDRFRSGLPIGAELLPAAEAEPCLVEAPRTLKQLLAWLPCITDDARELNALARKVRLWLPMIKARCPQHADAAIDWVQDALLRGCDKADVVSYATTMIDVYISAGGRKHVELAPRPDPEAPPTPAAPPRPSGYSPRKTKAERNAERAAEQAEAMMMFFGPKE